MPPRKPLDIIGRNPSRLFANGWVAVEKCRNCLFKNLCLENEKNPTIRRLILDEKTDQDELDRIDSMRDCGL